MYQFSSPHALAVFNDDEDATTYWRSIAASQRSQCFSLQHACDVTAAFNQTAQGLRIEFTYQNDQAVSEILLYGPHNAQNATAAVTLALACGLDLNQAVAGLNGFSGVAGRQQFIAGVNHSLLIDDSYNANPDSLRAAVDVLCALPGKAWLALGDMGELGADAEKLHQQAVADAFTSGVDEVFALGAMSCNAVAQYASRGRCFDSHTAMAEYLLPRLGRGVNLLIKGSRSARMEKLVTALRATDPTEEARHAV